MLSMKGEMRSGNFCHWLGDIHGEIHYISKKTMEKQNIHLTENDYLIICGDFGGVWYYPESRYYKKDAYLQKWLSQQPWTTLFVDGNHENHDLLNQYEISEWNGGKVHHIVKDKIIHLMRGQIFTIDGNIIFTMGGAQSHDMDIRKEWINWWRNELPSFEEYNTALDNLKKANWKVDYVISHCCCSSNVELLLAEKYNPDEISLLEAFFEGLTKNLTYKRWYCGHYHINENLPKDTTVLYHQIIPLGNLAQF